MDSPCPCINYWRPVFLICYHFLLQFEEHLLNIYCTLYQALCQRCKIKPNVTPFSLEGFHIKSTWLLASIYQPLPWLGEGTATHSSILAWEIPWTRSLVDYSPWGHKESDMTEWLTQAMLITKWLSPLAPFYTLLCQADAWMLQSTFSLVSLVLPEWARDMLLPLCLLFLSSEPICCFCNHLPD